MIRDRRYDWALGATNAADTQASEDIAIMNSINTAIAGYGEAEQRKDMDWEACIYCDGHGCLKCEGSGYSVIARSRRRR
mgnify:CR=1 FL=1